MNSFKPTSIDFRLPKNSKELVSYIGIEEKIFELATMSAATEMIYREYRIEKKGRKYPHEYRSVWEAKGSILSDAYKSFDRRFKLFLRIVEPNYPHPASYGYTKGRSTFDNALRHCGAPVILHADIKNFFPSISDERLREVFEKLGINVEVARLLSNFLTINGTLPLGLAPSPMIADFLCLNMDFKFERLAEESGCKYTRYADDITFSGRENLPTRECIKQIIENEGFTLSERKFYMTKRGQAHYVTGLSVSEPDVPHVPRAMKRKLRQELYYCRKFGIRDHIANAQIDMKLQRGINRIDGFVKYVAYNERKAQPHLLSEWRELLRREMLQVSYEPVKRRSDPGSTTLERYFVVDEAEINYQGLNFLAVSIVQILDMNLAENIISTLLREYLIDPFSSVRKEKLEKKKLHFTDANEDLRKAFIDILVDLPIRGYLAFGELKSNTSYEDLYFRLLGKMLRHRLMSCNGYPAEIIVEQNSKIKNGKIISEIDKIYNSLETANNRRPLFLETKVVGKSDNPSIAVPDFLLGVFSDYASQNKSKNDRKRLFFEKLRDKYRVILNVDNGTVFTRKHPFLPW